MANNKVKLTDKSVMINVLELYLKTYENTGLWHKDGVCYALYELLIRDDGYANTEYKLYPNHFILPIMNAADRLFLHQRSGPTPERFQFVRLLIDALKNDGNYYTIDQLGGRGTVSLRTDRSVPGARAARERLFKFVKSCPR